MGVRSVGESGETFEGTVVDPDPYGEAGTTTPGVTTAEGSGLATTPSEATLEPQQPPLLRLKTRLETRSKKPHGPNRPVQLLH